MDKKAGLEPLAKSEVRQLKARAQRMKAVLKVGKEGLSDSFMTALDDALKHNPLLKVKFEEFKEAKKTLTPEMAERSRSHLVTRVGNVVVLYRPSKDA